MSFFPPSLKYYQDDKEGWGCGVSAMQKDDETLQNLTFLEAAFAGKTGRKL